MFREVLAEHGCVPGGPLGSCTSSAEVVDASAGAARAHLLVQGPGPHEPRAQGSITYRAMHTASSSAAGWRYAFEADLDAYAETSVDARTWGGASVTASMSVYRPSCCDHRWVVVPVADGDDGRRDRSGPFRVTVDLFPSSSGDVEPGTTSISIRVGAAARAPFHGGRAQAGVEIRSATLSVTPLHRLTTTLTAPFASTIEARSYAPVCVWPCSPSAVLPTCSGGAACSTSSDRDGELSIAASVDADRPGTGG